jgi:hypothetical protein
VEDSGKNDGLLRRKRLRELLFQNCQSAADNNCVEDVRLVPFAPGIQGRARKGKHIVDAFEPTAPQRWRWLLIVGLPGLTALLAHTCFTPRFQSNDDPGMVMLAAGYGLGPRPSPFLIFMHPLLGQFLSSLYGMSPSVPWYALFMLGVRLLAGMAIAFAALDRRSTLQQVGLVVIYLLAFDLSGHVCPQFSRTAAAATQGAVLLWFSRRPDRPWNAALAITAAVLLTLGMMIRPDHAMLSLALASPLVCLDVLATLRGGCGCVDRRARLLTWARRTGAPLLVAGILVGGLLAYWSWFYAVSPGWSDFERYNRLRSQFTDFCRDNSTPTSEQALAQVGWSRNDLAMIRAFFFADRQVFSADNLRKYLAISRPLLHFRLPEWKGQLAALWSNYYLRLPLTAIFFTALFIPGRAWLHFGAVGATAGAALWLVAGVMRHYCPQHFVQALLAFVAGVGVVLSGPVSFGPLRKMGLVLGLLAVTYFNGRVCWELHLRSIQSQILAEELKSAIKELNPRPDQLYVVWGGFFPYEYLLPFDSGSHMRDFKFYGLGCATNTPTEDERLREFGIDDLVTALYTRNDVFVICDGPLPKMLETYIAEHRGVRVQMNLLYETYTDLLPQKRLFRVFRAVRADTAKYEDVGSDSKPREGHTSCPSAHPPWESRVNGGCLQTGQQNRR